MYLVCPPLSPPPPPPPKKNLLSPIPFGTTVIFGGGGGGEGGINKVHYGLGEKGALGKNGMYKRVNVHLLWDSHKCIMTRSNYNIFLHFFFFFVRMFHSVFFTMRKITWNCVCNSGIGRVNFSHRSVIYFWLGFSHRSYHYQGVRMTKVDLHLIKILLKSNPLLRFIRHRDSLWNFLSSRRRNACGFLFAVSRRE